MSEWRASANFEEIAFQWVALPARRSVASKIAGGRLACRLFKVEQLRLKTTLVKLKNPMKMENNRVSVVRLCQRTQEKN